MPAGSIFTHPTFLGLKMLGYPGTSATTLGIHLERWLSGRRHRTRNAAYGKLYREFESLPLRSCFILRAKLSKSMKQTTKSTRLYIFNAICVGIFLTVFYSIGVVILVNASALFPFPQPALRISIGLFVLASIFPAMILYSSIVRKQWPLFVLTLTLVILSSLSVLSDIGGLATFVYKNMGWVIAAIVLFGSIVQVLNGIITGRIARITRYVGRSLPPYSRKYNPLHFWFTVITLSVIILIFLFQAYVLATGHTILEPF
jgi:hypothetical protein